MERLVFCLRRLADGGIQTMRRITLLALLLFAVKAHATNFNASSCSVSDITAAFNSAVAAGSGNTVVVPSCSIAWTTPLSLSTNVCVSIIGQSTVASTDGFGNPLTFNDSTEIIDNVNHASTSDFMALFNFTGNSGSNSTVCGRVSGLTFYVGTGGTSNNGDVLVTGTSQQVRVDHNHFYLLQQLELSRDGQLAGVGDHNLFDMADLGERDLGTGWNASSPGSGDVQGDGSWADSTCLGCSNEFYWENNTYRNTATAQPTPANDCLDGGRFVVRFNTFLQGAAVQTHPTGHAGDSRGCRQWEIYQNQFSWGSYTTNAEYNMFFASSGTGVMWGNNVSQYSNFLTLHSMRRNNNTYPESPPPNEWGFCGTSFNGTGSAWDLNSNTSSGYRCLDQVGAGKSDLLGGLFPTKCDLTTGCTTYNGTWPNQAFEPVYEWMDAWTGAPGFPGSFLVIQDTPSYTNNLDVYLWCNSASPSGCSTFNGTQGVGSGSLAARPSTCTTGVGYWATDQGSWNTSGGASGLFYKCTSTNTWTQTYTPYTYPHPLAGGGGTPQASAPTFAPASPYTGGPTTVTASSSTTGSGPSIYFDSSNPPTTNSTTYNFTTTITLYAYVHGYAGYLDSPVSVWTGTLTSPTCADPTQNPPYSGNYTPASLPLNVTWASPTSGCNMFYTATTDGSMPTAPTCSSAAYPSGGFNITATGNFTWRLIACQAGYISSNIKGGEWVVSAPVPLSYSGLKLQIKTD